MRLLPTLPTLSLGADTTACAGADVLLRPSFPARLLAAPVTYHWSTGATTPTLRVQQAGTYSLQVITRCGVQTASRQVTFTPCLTVPNIITPNADGYNDEFKVDGLQGAWTLCLFNRWGRKVYETATYRNDWGREAAPGVYYYQLSQPAAGAVYRGWLTVIR
ncbi:T9SS type B sorting domain-containing protein [Hymenobacter swuensis]|uniref:T9SS type B sorting domain-containing protein n=1 Tax=Hymenobacter swuensis TaxID=1446467 RepID=UPI001E2C19B6|nr:gliding motility-associated C-terminal domain-containing protein [Hymenobacter swuensis]